MHITDLSRKATFSIPVTLIITLLLAGCSSTYSTHSNVVSLTVEPDSALTINQKIDFKPERTRVFIQDGLIVSQFNHYKPHCNLEITIRDDDNWQSVSPASYQVTGTRQTLQQVVKFTPGVETQVAALRYAANDSGQPDIYRGMHYYLQGADSNVRKLSCRGALAPPHEAEPPTLAEIDQVLGNIMTLRL